MKLPEISVPIFECTIPSTQEVLRFRPFLHKEYKTILQGIELGDASSFVRTIEQIFSDCTFGKYDIQSQPIFDTEYLFLQLRSKSIGERVEVRYVCNHHGESGPCKQSFLVGLDLGKVGVGGIDTYQKSRLVRLSPTVMLKLKAPTFLSYRFSQTESAAALSDYIYSCTESFIHEEAILRPGIDFGPEDLAEFIDNLSGDQIRKISDFFESVPRVSVDVDLRCPKCKHSETARIEGLNDFFV